MQVGENRPSGQFFLMTNITHTKRIRSMIFKEVKVNNKQFKEI
jgi:hypothetical protein